jgi:hypothetical protein
VRELNIYVLVTVSVFSIIKCVKTLVSVQNILFNHFSAYIIVQRRKIMIR